MSKPMIREHNTETNEVIDREMTDDEFARYQEGQAKYQAEENLKAEAAAKRQALLDKLGITEDEARLLLGGN
jgi:ParB-like chromosome segregation protein Spo0J